MLEKDKHGQYYYLDKKDSELYEAVKDSDDPWNQIIRHMLEDKSAQSRRDHCRWTY